MSGAILTGTVSSANAEGSLGFAAMSEADYDLKNLGRHIEHRVRVEMDKTWTEFERISGITSAQIRKIRNGTAGGIRPETARKLEVALRWRQGSVRKCLQGGEPEPLETALLRPDAQGGGDIEVGDDVEADLVQRWAGYLNQPFTSDALKQLIDDFKTVKERALACAERDPNE